MRIHAMEPGSPGRYKLAALVLKTTFRREPEAGALPANSAKFPFRGATKHARLISGKSWCKSTRKDGSEALAGERLSEAQEGTVRLRREPPIFAVPRLFVERTVQLRKEFHDPPALRIFQFPW